MSTKYTEHIDEVMEQLPNNPAIVPADNRTPQSSNITLEAWNRVQARLVALETLVAKLGKGGFATAVQEDVSAEASARSIGDGAIRAEITTEAIARQLADDTKLDKVTSSSSSSLRVYGINADGSQTTKRATVSDADTIMMRNGAGKSHVTTPSSTDIGTVIANKEYVDGAGFLKNIGFYNNLVPAASQSVNEVIIDGVTYYTLGGLSDVKAGYAYYVAAVNNIDYWDTFVCLQVVNGTALFWPFRTISGSVPNNLTARKHVFVIDENGKNDTIKYSVDPHAGTGYRSIMQRDADGRSQVNDPAANLDVANKQWTLAQISSLGTVFNVKGTVATVSALPASGNSVGDVYFVTADNSEYVWTSSNAWEQFGPTIDINGAIDTRLSSKYDIREGNGLLEIGSSGHNLYFTGYEAITLETADGGSGNSIELYDSYGYNYLRVNSTAGITLLADHKFNISAAGGDTYVRTDNAMDLHLYGSGSVQVDGAFRIENDSPNASPFHYDAGCIQMCNGKVYLDYATNSNYTTNTFNIAIPNLYKTFNKNTGVYSDPYLNESDGATLSEMNEILAVLS